MMMMMMMAIVPTKGSITIHVNIDDENGERYDDGHDCVIQDMNQIRDTIIGCSM